MNPDDLGEAFSALTAALRVQVLDDRREALRTRGIDPDSPAGNVVLDLMAQAYEAAKQDILQIALYGHVHRCEDET